MPKHLRSLTGLRALAALAVVGVHVQILTTGRLHEVLQHVASPGRIGVSFFFALSGFVLTWSAKPGQRARDFYRHRIARVYPAYVAALAGGAAVMHFVEHTHVPHGEFIADLFLAQAWIPDHNYYFAINGVLWSLSCEAFFYLLFPPLLAALTRLDAARQTRLGLAVLAVFASVQIVCLVSRPDASVALGRGGAAWAAYICPPVRLCEFVLGMLLALRMRDGWRSPVAFAPALAALAVVYVIAGFGSASIGWEALTIIPALGVLAAAAGRDVSGRGPSLWASDVVVWAGTVSYSVYLVHQLVVRVVLAHVHASWQAGGRGGVLLIVTIAAAVLIASALHYVVERPAERRLRGSGSERVDDLPKDLARSVR